MASALEQSCRLYVILARDGRSAVVFRRGPTKQVLVLRWWLGPDEIEPGQWLRGRIYERRCDLSPDGDLLIYFAANWQQPLQTWTAVSRTPYLTALALWPKGDAWGGGGLFEGPLAIGLNHLAVDAPMVPGAAPANWHPLGPERLQELPENLQVRRWSEHAGRGEDNPIQHHRMTRDGWAHIAEGERGPHRASGYSWLFHSPEIYERRSPVDGLVLRRILKAIHKKNGPWYVEDFEVRRADGERLRLIEDCSWADWHRNGDLLFALGGSLYRLAASDASERAGQALENAGCVADLSGLRFQRVETPDWARQWP